MEARDVRKLRGVAKGTRRQHGVEEGRHRYEAQCRDLEKWRRVVSTNLN